MMTKFESESIMQSLEETDGRVKNWERMRRYLNKNWTDEVLDEENGRLLKIRDATNDVRSFQGKDDKTVGKKITLHKCWKERTKNFELL